mgnify:FL=1
MQHNILKVVGRHIAAQKAEVARLWFKGMYPPCAAYQLGHVGREIANIRSNIQYHGARLYALAQCKRDLWLERSTTTKAKPFGVICRNHEVFQLHAIFLHITHDFSHPLNIKPRRQTPV